MTVTNPDSLLDKNGLAYYHSKVKDMIRDATKVNVNVIQSEHQRIGYSIESNNYGLQPVTEVQSGEIYYNSNWGEWVEGYIENGSFVNGSNVKILFAPEDGYSCGNLVLNLDGRALIEDEDYEVNHQYQAGKYNYYEVYIFVAYGGFLTISATPATVSEPTVETVEFDVAFNIFGYAIDNSNNPIPIQFRQAEITKSPVFYFSGTESPSGVEDADIVISPNLSLIASGTGFQGGTLISVDREERVSNGQFDFTKGQVSANHLVSPELGGSGRLKIKIDVPIIRTIQLKSRSNTSNIELTPYLDIFLKTPSGDISIDSKYVGSNFTVSTNDSNSKTYTLYGSSTSYTMYFNEEIVQRMKEGRSTLYFQVAFHTN